MLRKDGDDGTPYGLDTFRLYSTLAHDRWRRRNLTAKSIFSNRAGQHDESLHLKATRFLVGNPRVLIPLLADYNYWWTITKQNAETGSDLTR